MQALFDKWVCQTHTVCACAMSMECIYSNFKLVLSAGSKLRVMYIYEYIRWLIWYIYFMFFLHHSAYKLALFRLADNGKCSAQCQPHTTNKFEQLVKIPSRINVFWFSAEPFYHMERAYFRHISRLPNDLLVLFEQISIFNIWQMRAKCTISEYNKSEHDICHGTPYILTMLNHSEQTKTV